MEETPSVPLKMEFADRIKSSVDIVQVVGDYVRLRRVGGSSSRYTGLCPFHREKTPSFSVNGQHQFYKCFGCGVGGDVIKFVMEIEHMTFWEAAKSLAEQHGIPLPENPRQNDEATRQRAVLFEMHEIAQKLFRENLYGPAGQEVRAYLQKRGVTQQTAEEFGMGFADRGGQTLTRIFERRGYSAADMEASGLVLKRNEGTGFFDRFRGRLMFPIHSESGKVIAFGGRAMGDDEPKYLNSSETAIYSKSLVLYNLHRARRAVQEGQFAILVEGYMDAVGLYAAGFRNVVAPCGTALTPHQVRSLKRHSQNLVLNFDPDAAGERAVERSAQILLEEGVNTRVVSLPGELDPDEFILKEGPEAYEQAVAHAQTYFHWLADRARQRFDRTTPEGRTQFLKFLLPAIQWLPDKTQRLATADDLAESSGIPAGMIRDEFRKAAADRRAQRVVQEMSLPDPNEFILLHAILSEPGMIESLAEDLTVLAGMPGLRMGAILGVIMNLRANGESVNFGAVHARLNEPDKIVLASLLHADETLRDPVSLEQAQECVRKLHSTARAAGREQLRQQIKQAERNGDFDLALKLTEELQRLKH